MMSSDWGLIIVAAGSGQRFGGGVPKQYARLAGRSVLGWALQAFEGLPAVVVADPDHAVFYGPVLAGLSNVEVVAGGATRQDSVRLGLEALAARAPRHVMVHDAARPLIDAESIARIRAAVEGGVAAATLAVPVVDTLVRGAEVVDREGVQAVQTPQAFDFAVLRDAHGRAPGGFTDDVSLVRAVAGVEAVLVQGHADNFKITTPEDLARAERLLLAGHAETRTGLGFDVHRFGPGDGVRLFGVDIPCDRSLVGHSDADAGLHAVADAILGIAAAGDIGVLFPPGDPQWKDMDSGVIVEKALALLHAKGGILRHVDIMLMSETPRIGPHRAAIIARLSGLLGLPADAIGLKATTMEQMGFVGRGEGLTVQAVATARMRA